MAPCVMYVQFPVMQVVALNETQFIVVGGGGAAKTGIPNGISLATFGSGAIAETEFVSFDDERVQAAVVHNDGKTVYCLHGASCTQLSFAKDKLTKKKTIKCSDDDEGRRVIALNSEGDKLFTSDGKGLSVYATGDLSKLLSVASTEKTFPHKKEIRDATVDAAGERVATVDDDSLALWDIKGKGKLIGNADVPIKTSKFCGCRFAPDGNSVFTGQGQRDGGWITQWGIDGEKFAVLRTVKVSNVGVTSFTMSPSGSLLGFGVSDAGVAVIPANKLGAAASVQVGHDFGVSGVAFTSDERNLVSASLDKSVSFTAVRRLRGGSAFKTLMTLMLVILVVLLALEQFQIDTGALPVLGGRGKSSAWPIANAKRYLETSSNTKAEL